LLLQVVETTLNWLVEQEIKKSNKENDRTNELDFITDQMKTGL